MSSCNIGTCGICGVCGEMESIQRHVLEVHVVNEGHEYDESVEYEYELSSQSFINTETPSTSNSGVEWAQPETRLLLDRYLKMVGPMKRYKRKKDMWLQISNDIKSELNISKTALQCENRYKTVIKRKKKAVEDNNKSGNSRTTVEYEEELRKISSQDDSIEPEVLRDATNVVVNSKAIVNKEEPKIKKRKTEKSVQEVLLEVYEKKEQARERRHQEKMLLLKEVLKGNEQE